MVCPWFLLGLQPERIWVGVREGNLNKVLFCASGVALWCGVAKRRGGGRTVVAAHIVSGGYIRRKMLGE